MKEPNNQALRARDPMCLCCNRVKSEHERGQCPETVYFVEMHVATDRHTEGRLAGLEEAARASHAAIGEMIDKIANAKVTDDSAIRSSALLAASNASTFAIRAIAKAGQL